MRIRGLVPDSENERTSVRTGPSLSAAPLHHSVHTNEAEIMMGVGSDGWQQSWDGLRQPRGGPEWMPDFGLQCQRERGGATTCPTSPAWPGTATMTIIAGILGHTLGLMVHLSNTCVSHYWWCWFQRVKTELFSLKLLGFSKQILNANISAPVRDIPFAER